MREEETRREGRRKRIEGQEVLCERVREDEREWKEERKKSCYLHVVYYETIL